MYGKYPILTTVGVTGTKCQRCRLMLSVNARVPHDFQHFCRVRFSFITTPTLLNGLRVSVNTENDAPTVGTSKLVVLDGSLKQSYSPGWTPGDYNFEIRTNGLVETGSRRMSSPGPIVKGF